MASEPKQYYELYRRSSVGTALTDTLDSLIGDQRIDPQLAMRIVTHFDKAIAMVLDEKVKSRMSFKGHLDTYRFCDDVWTFIIKDINFKLDNNQQVHSDRIKIVSCSSKRPASPTPSQQKHARARANKKKAAPDRPFCLFTGWSSANVPTPSMSQMDDDVKPLIEADDVKVSMEADDAKEGKPRFHSVLELDQYMQDFMANALKKEERGEPWFK